MARQVVRDNRTGRERDSVQYGMSSLSDLAPDRALALLRGHGRLKTGWFYVKEMTGSEKTAACCNTTIVAW